MTGGRAVRPGPLFCDEGYKGVSTRPGPPVPRMSHCPDRLSGAARLPIREQRGFSALYLV